MVRIIIDRLYEGGLHYIKAAGLADDTKPSGVITGSEYIAVDTGDMYAYDEEGDDWNKTGSVGVSPEAIAAAVDAWLDDHPEATTTVEDGAISYQTLDSTLKGKMDDVGNLKTAIDDLSTATSLDVGKALSPKTVANGKVTEWQYKVIGGGGGGGAVEDVQINGTSIVDGEGVANVPIASTDNFGVAKININQGIGVDSVGKNLIVSRAGDSQVKAGANLYKPIVPGNQHQAAFYGLATAAGDSTQSASNNSVGTYTESAKSAISQMLSGSVAITGTTPSITALPGIRYVCGEVATLAITLPASGIVDIVFESGSTPTVLTVTPPTGVSAVKWANGFDPTSLDANTTYEINIADGEYGVVGAWT